MEQYVINTIMLQTMLASKISRIIQAAQGKAVGFVPVRTHGIDSAMKAHRVGRMLGVHHIGFLLGWYKAGEKTQGGALTTHYFILAHHTEQAAFEALARYGGQKLAILIDTYNSIQGLKRFIKVAKMAEKNKTPFRAIALDSGDLYVLSRRARTMLDAHGLSYIKILGMSNLDEYSIERLVKKGAPLDTYSSNTEMLNVTDAPKLEVVFKMSELIENGKPVYKMKFSPAKQSLPGRKQVFRVFQNRQAVRDEIALDFEKRSGTPLLRPIMKKGKLVSRLPKLEEIRKHYETEVEHFDQKLFSVRKKFIYPVQLTPSLKRLMRRLADTSAVQHDEISF